MSQNQNEKESGGQEPKTDSNSDFISELLVELLKKKKIQVPAHRVLRLRFCR